MKMRETVWIWTLGTALVIFAAAGARGQTQAPAQAPSQQHVVSLDDLHQDAAQHVATRQADEAAVRDLLSSDAGQTALNSMKMDYQRVDKAIGRLSDEDLAKVAARSRQAESDFAAGGLTSTLIIVIILIVVLIVVLSLVF